jgi:hypothetical protein
MFDLYLACLWDLVEAVRRLMLGTFRIGKQDPLAFLTSFASECLRISSNQDVFEYSNILHFY